MKVPKHDFGHFWSLKEHAGGSDQLMVCNVF